MKYCNAMGAALITASIALGAPTFAADKPEAKPGDRSQTKKDGDAATSTGPVLLLVPMVFAIDDKVANGCWARIYDKENFAGNMTMLVGPVDIASAKPASVTGLELGRNYDSVVVGPRATLTVWDNANYRDKTATFKAGQRISNLDGKMGYFEEIKSLKISCAK